MASHCAAQDPTLMETFMYPYHPCTERAHEIADIAADVWWFSPPESVTGGLTDSRPPHFFEAVSRRQNRYP